MTTESEKLDALYARLPTIQCKKLCRDYCGPVPFTAEEARRMVSVFGSVPSVRPDLSCEALCPVTGTCNAYEARPFICRLWGLVKGLRCPHGCQPDRMLTEKEERQLMKIYGTMKPVVPLIR